MNKLLVVVDFQNDFVNGALGFEGAQLLDSRICARIERALAEGWRVVFTLDTHQEDYLETREGKSLPVPHCIAGSDGHAVFGRAKEYLSRADAVFVKPTFGSSELFYYIRGGGFDEIELCGLVTNICVLANAVLAKTAAPEAAVSVDSALVMSFDPALHAKTLDVLEGIQIEVKR